MATLSLDRSLAAWRTAEFRDVFKAEVAALDSSLLPLQAGLTHSSHALGDKIDVVILSTEEAPESLRVRAGLFYAGIIAGCSCADDPTPASEIAEYCEAEFVIDRRSGDATVSIIG